MLAEISSAFIMHDAFPDAEMQNSKAGRTASEPQILSYDKDKREAHDQARSTKDFYDTIDWIIQWLRNHVSRHEY